MSYDHDLKWFRRVVWAGLALHGELAIKRALHYDWPTMVTYLIWFATMCGWLWIVKIQQRTRDMIRLNDAMFVKVMETIDGQRDEA